MIASKSNSNIYVAPLPFEAKYDEKEKTVFFSGYVVNCYSDIDNEFQEIKGGSSYINIYGSYPVEYGDWFYVDARKNVEESSIKKISKSLRENFPFNQFEIPVLIWKAPEKKGGSGEQILSENIFLQDYESCRKIGLNFYKKEGDLFFMPGYVVCPAKNYSKFFGQILSPEENYRFKITAKIQISEKDPTNKGDVEYIKSYSIDNAVLESYLKEEEDEPAFLNLDENSLTGTYYVNLPSYGGVVILSFAASEISRAIISPAFETQVRGAKFYKNGVSTSLFNSEHLMGEEGFYSSIEEERIYDKFTINEDGSVDASGDYSIVTVFTIENPQDLIVDLAPIILSETTENGLADNEFIVGPREIKVIPSGGEISSDAYSQCVSEVREIEWTPLAIWNGDSTASISGAGGEGFDDKLNQVVIHAERRFKKVGTLNQTPEDLTKMPQKFSHYSIIQWSDASDSDVSGDIDLNKEKLVYIDESWTEIQHKEDGVFGIELIMAESEIEAGNTLVLDVTRNVTKKYQLLEINRTSSRVV